MCSDLVIEMATIRYFLFCHQNYSVKIITCKPQLILFHLLSVLCHDAVNCYDYPASVLVTLLSSTDRMLLIGKKKKHSKKTFTVTLCPPLISHILV